MRHSSTSLLSEPPLSDDASAKLLEAYENDAVSPQDYLALVTEKRAFTPPPTNHAVVIKSGSYCANDAVPVILKSFLQSHGNPVVKEVLSQHGVAMVEKIPSGGVLVHVRSATMETKLVGQEVNLMGMKFKIARQSLLMDKFFLDVAGIHSKQEADALFFALCDLGARPLYLTPRDVNLEAQVATPTWRFYFGSTDPPQCLVVHSYVTHQLVLGKVFYVVRGKHSTPPPARATVYRQSQYAVVLPCHATPVTTDVWSTQPQTTPLADHVPRAVSRVNRAKESQPSEIHPPSAPPVEKPPEMVPAHAAACHRSRRDSVAQPAAEYSDSDASMSSDEAQWLTHGTRTGDIDTDMAKESGLKRVGASFAHANRFAPLADHDCQLEVVEPETAPGVTAGVVIVPHLVKDSDAPPHKRVVVENQQPDGDDETLALQEALLLSEKEAELSTSHDRVMLSVQHAKATDALLSGSKNMDQIVQSIVATPLAWTKSFLKDLADGGAQTMELADIHLWNRVLAAEAMDDDTIRTFHERISELKLPMGTTRKHYTEYFKAAFDQLPVAAQNDWNLLRWLSIFELLALCMCPSLFTQHAWVQQLLQNAEAGLPHGHVKLFTDRTLLQLLHTELGEQILAVLENYIPGCAICTGLTALRASDRLPESLPVLTSSLLTSLRAEAEPTPSSTD